MCLTHTCHVAKVSDACSSKVFDFSLHTFVFPSYLQCKAHLLDGVHAHAATNGTYFIFNVLVDSAELLCRKCSNAATFFCQDCNPRGDPWLLCEQCYRSFHKTLPTRKHVLLSANEYGRRSLLREVPTTEKLRKTYETNLFIGRHEGSEELIFGPGFEQLRTSNDAIITFAGPTASGKSFLIRSLIADALASMPLSSSPKQFGNMSCTCDSQVFFGNLNGKETAFIDLEGIRGTAETSQGRALLEANSKKIEEDELERRKITPHVFPPTLYAISDILIYLVAGSSSEIGSYGQDLIGFARTAASRIVNNERPALLIAFNKVSRAEISANFLGKQGIKAASTAWKEANPRLTEELLRYFSTVELVYIPNVDVAVKEGLQQIDVLKEHLGHIIDSRKPALEGLAATKKAHVFARLAEAAKDIFKDGGAFFDCAAYIAEGSTKAWLTYFNQIRKEDYQAFKQHLEMANQLVLARLLKENYKPAKIDLLRDVDFEDVPRELPERFARLLSERLSCQAACEFVCASKDAPFTVKCDVRGDSHQGAHKSHEVFFTEAKTEADKYWAQGQAKRIAHPCAWDGGFQSVSLGEELKEFDPQLLLSAIPQEMPYFGGCPLCFSAFELAYLSCGHSPCRACKDAFEEVKNAERVCLICNKEYYLDKFRLDEKKEILEPIP